jgi:hypothetical protein
MKPILFLSLLLSFQAISSHDTLMKFVYPATNIQEVGVCMAQHMVIDSYSTSSSAGLMAQNQGLLNKVNVVSSGLNSEELTNLNYFAEVANLELIQFSYKDEFETNDKINTIVVNTRKYLEISLNSGVSKKVINQNIALLNFFIIKNALIYHDNIRVEFSLNDKINVLNYAGFYTRTKYPFNKKSPVLNKIQDFLLKNKIMTKNCY